MTLAGGDVLRYQALKRGPLADYLLALDNFVPPAPTSLPATGERPARPTKK